MEAADVLRAEASQDAVFGFATGNTPLNIYAELQRSGPIQIGGAFSLDEYVGLNEDDERSFAWYVKNRIEPALGLPTGFISCPNGAAHDVSAEAARFEASIFQSPIDIQLLGTGRNGHVAFNEPGSSADSLTRIVDLDEITRIDNGADFGGLAPSQAITQGVGTILRAKKLLLVATGKGKAEPIRRLLAGEKDAQWPLTLLLDHPDLLVLVDRAAVD